MTNLKLQMGELLSVKISVDLLFLIAMSAGLKVLIRNCFRSGQ